MINGLKVARFVSQVSDESSQVVTAQAYLTRYFETLPLGESDSQCFSVNRTDPDVSSRQRLCRYRPPARRRLCAPGRASLRYRLAALSCAYDPQLVFPLSLTRSTPTDDRSYLERALVVLDYALQRSKYKYQIRILTINLLRLLGASSLALTHYRILGVKAIQYDTLSHLVLTRAATFAVASGSDAEVHEEALTASKWYKVGEHEASEMAVRVFSFHNYSKVRLRVDGRKASRVFADGVFSPVDRRLCRVSGSTRAVLVQVPSPDRDAEDATSSGPVERIPDGRSRQQPHAYGREPGW
jgi:hypothetical protein